MLPREPLIHSKGGEAFRETQPDLILGMHRQHVGNGTLGEKTPQAIIVACKYKF
jgi:hypothetical protein